MKKFNAKKVIAQILTVGIITSAVFPGTAYAAEVGEQMAEGQQAVMETVASEKEQQDLETENTDQTQNEQSQEDDQTEDAEPAPTVTEYTSADQVLDASTVADEDIGRRLILTADILPEELYGANSVDHYDDLYLLTYENKEACASAYDAFVSAGYVVEKDDLLDAIDPDEIPETKVQDEVTTETIDDLVPTVGTKQTLVAVVDTGISDVTNDDVFKDRIIEGTSVISDSYVDDNGHGTAMAKIIAEDTAEKTDVMILPIKALDENGKGTVLSIALAIKYAKEHGADVINLSLSGVGQSNVLTNAINDCYNNNITVVTAAGNDNADAKDYIPGNVDTAINVAAVDKDTDGKIVSATYTNHGDNVDFAALGIYHLSVDKDEVSLETELRGTSIASAHVAAYVAVLKQINSEVTETDVMESLKASADDFDGTADKIYFGNGFLAKENLVFLKSDVEDQDKETDADETEDDRNQKIEVATKKTIFIDQNHWWGFNDDNNWSAGGFDNAHPNGSPAQGLNVAIAWFRGAGCDELEVCMMGNVQTYDSVFVPINMKLTIYGESIFSAGQKTWQRIGSGGDSPVIGGATSDNGDSFGLAYNEHTKIELHTVNIWDNTSTVVSFDDTPGAVSSPDIYAESCSFFSENHWWSVGTSNGTFNKCTFDNTWGHNYNVGAIASWKYLTCTNCTFSGNGSVALSRAITYTGLLGGGLDCRGSMYIDGCTINNYGGWNTAIGCSGNVTIKNTTINVNKNTSSEDVGIIYGGAQSGQSITIDNCNVYNAGMEGIRIDNNDAKTNLTKASISNSTIHGCDTGIKVNTGIAAVSNCNIYSNKYGIENKGTLYFKSGNVYSNTYGGRNYGTLHMSGGTIYSNTYDGIRNAGTLNISSGTIRNNEYGVANGIYDEDRVNKSGTLNMTGGTISGNTVDGIYNRFGTATITGGTIKDNKRYGTYNKATMNYTGGSSGGNSEYDVYQKGNYKMSGSASTYSNGVFLAKGKIIEITGPLNCADGAIKVTIQRLDSTVGRTVAKCTYGMNKANADAMLGKFALQNKETRTIGADGKTFRKAALRSATGTNGTVGNIILSEEYYVTYDGNVQNVHVTFKLPERQTIYWKEDVDVPTVGTTVYYDGRVFQSLRNVGYSKTTDGKGTSCKIGQTMHFSANEVTKDQILYAQYTTAADLSINGNTQTAGDNYVIYGFVSNETALPDNTFEKIYSGIEYDENLEKDIPYKTVYSHHGWSYSDQAMYKDSGVGKCGETFDLTPRILEMLQQGQESVSEEGYINNLTLYAVWDEPPKITAKNKYWNTDAIRAGKLNKEDLLRTASAQDKEDGTDVTLEVEDFDIEKFLHLGEYGWMSVRYKATDGAGNVSYKLIKVVVVQSGIVQGEFYDPNPAYVRMIDRENYNKKSHEEGGLMEDSVWYTIPTYKKTILDAFDRLDNGEAIVRYHFSCKDIREAQAFETEAMENGTYPTAAHWEAWLKKFEHCKVFDTGYRSSKELNNSIDPEDYEDYEEPEE